jgi:hypothetical protein
MDELVVLASPWAKALGAEASARRRGKSIELGNCKPDSQRFNVGTRLTTMHGARV